MARSKRNRDIPRKCAKCGVRDNLEFHHFLPAVKWYWEHDGVYLCSSCHKEFHNITKPHYMRIYLKPKSWYYVSLIKWVILVLIIYLLN